MSTWGTRRGVKRSTRERIMARDHGMCQLGYPNRCLGNASEIDHVGDPHDDSDENLRAVCGPCHRHRSLEQQRAGIAASAARRRDRLKLPSARAGAKHPGDW